MAGKRPSARRPRQTSRAPAARPSGSASAAGRAALVAARWLLTTARPRSAAELLSLLLVCLALGILAALGLSALRGGQGIGLEAFWCVAFLMMALAARLSPWWRAELRTMTPQRARNYGGSALLVFVALSVCWHVLSVNLGLGNAYLVLGPLSQAPGAVAALILLTAAGLVLAFDIPVGVWLREGHQLARRESARLRERRVLKATTVDDLPGPAPREEEPAAPPRPRKRARPQPPMELVTAVPRNNGPLLPPIDVFNRPPKGPAAPLDLELKARRIEETLASFNVGARVVGHHCGPVVTQFDIQPDRGVKVRRITELQNDLALSLAAPTIRIQAPVPGKPVVGVEIPNDAATMVALRELLESDPFQVAKSPLRVALGKDVAGNAMVIDLARMPHLLVSGATGSGKSVCINTIIASLLYQNTPEQVRLMMIDPKMVELTVYNGVPHLLSPVVTQMEKVVGVLQWALREMERRYQLFADSTVRNIQRYNEKMEGLGLKRLPYIVLIVDELADLMMVAPEDVEDAVCRLAQLARAAGIHLVIATQRPSVDVITGLIKANFPARIAFAMTSQVDSRTILDTVGAEKLLGRGDMLYQPPDGPKPVRLQGAHVSDQEIERLVEFWKQSPLQREVAQVPAAEFAAAEQAAGGTEDELFHEAVRMVREYQHASVSLLQRRLKVGYARAARLMDQLEAHGVVGPADGSKQRQVLAEEGEDA